MLEDTHVIHAEHTGVGEENAVAVYGEATLGSGYGRGGVFRGDDTGVCGESYISVADDCYGVRGTSSGVGLPGAESYGVYGSASNAEINYGLYGIASHNDAESTNYGIYATASGTSATNYAGYFEGNVEVVGEVRMTDFEMPTDASAGHVLMSDGAGVGTWQALPADRTTGTGPWSAEATSTR
jgi:hypothetical protein